MRIGTANILGTDDGLNIGQVVKIGYLAKTYTDFCGFQEVKTVQEIEALRYGAAIQKQVLVTQSYNPIMVPATHAPILDKGFERLTPPIPGVNPKRELSWIVTRMSISPVAIINAHLTNKGPEADDWSEAEKIRKEYWLQGYAGIKEKVLEFKRDGIPSFVIGDLNKRRVPKFTRDFEWYSTGIDKVGFQPVAKAHFYEQDTLHINTPSDHHMLVVDGTFRRK